jgi:short-subunit dehydrogenase
MKKAIVVGATSGIGLELARILVSNGYRVGIAGRREERLRALQLEQPEAYCYRVIDVTDPFDVLLQLDALMDELQGMDLLVLSSGTGDLHEVLELGIEQRTIDTNVLGFTRVVDWAFDRFQTLGAGSLVAITSVAGLRGSRHSPSYGATKAYQIHYLQALRQLAAHRKLPLRIIDVRPGLVDTAMAKGDGLFWVASPQKAADQLYKGIQKGRAVVYVTKRWRYVACVLRALPAWVYHRL